MMKMPIFVPDDYGPDIVLNSIDQIKAMEWVLEIDVEINKKFKNPFRVHFSKNDIRYDNTPGCYFDYHDYRLVFIDWAYKKFHSIDVIQVAALKFNIGYYSAFILIKKKFFKSIDAKKPAVSTFSKSRIPIKYSYKSDYDDGLLDYFYEGAISEDNLIEDNILELNWYSYTIYGKERYIDLPNKLNFLIPVQNSVKICMPNNIQRFKWFSNVDENNIGGIDKIDYSKEYIIITKSYKDWRVLINLGYNAIWFQNETCVPWKSVIDYYSIFYRFSKIIIFYDNDGPGIQGSITVRNKLLIYYPDYTGQIYNVRLDTLYTDPFDVIKHTSEENLIKELKIILNETCII